MPVQIRELISDQGQAIGTKYRTKKSAESITYGAYIYFYFIFFHQFFSHTDCDYYYMYLQITFDYIMAL